MNQLDHQLDMIRDVIKEMQERIVALRLRSDAQDEILKELYIKISDLEAIHLKNKSI